MEITSDVLRWARERTLEFLKYKLSGNPLELYEDAVQKAFFDLYQKKLGNAFATEPQLLKWLRTAAWWHALKELRRRNRQVSVTAVEENGCDDKAIHDFENMELLIKLKAKLPRKKSEAIEKILQGFTVQEIAKSLVEKSDTIKHRYNSAVRTMQILWEIEAKKISKE
jgi:DNA-directed RNA polymerase specialized sigma24 family protein